MANYRKSKPTYLKRKRRINWLAVFILLGLIAGVVFAVKKAYQYFNTPEEVVIEYSLTGLSVEESKLALSDPHIEEGEFELVDYVLYGESLSLYANTYEVGKKDELMGKNIMCRNLSTGKEYVFYLGNKLDEAIPIYELPFGVYEVYVSSIMANERMYMEKETFEEFYSVTRNGETHKFTLLADTNYFYSDDETLSLEKPYVYFMVEKAKLPENYYDIIIDPGHFAYDCYADRCTGYIDNGSVANNNTFIESHAVYDVSLVIARELEAAGLKVMLTRDDKTPVDMYGEGGRVDKTIATKAKFYISNHLNSFYQSYVRGTEVWHSIHSSPKLAETVLNSLLEKTTIASGGTGNPIKRIVTSSLENSDYKKPLDGFMMIREPGGKGTGAGTLSSSTINLNGPIVKDKNYGAQAILVEYIYMSNPYDASKWQENYEEYGKAVAEAIIEYINLDFFEKLRNEEMGTRYPN